MQLSTFAHSIEIALQLNIKHLHLSSHLVMFASSCILCSAQKESECERWKCANRSENSLTLKLTTNIKSSNNPLKASDCARNFFFSSWKPIWLFSSASNSFQNGRFKLFFPHSLKRKYHRRFYAAGTFSKCGDKESGEFSKKLRNPSLLQGLIYQPRQRIFIHFKRRAFKAQKIIEFEAFLRQTI